MTVLELEAKSKCLWFNKFYEDDLSDLIEKVDIEVYEKMILKRIHRIITTRFRNFEKFKLFGNL